jgi:hypothetical protein
LLLSLNRSCVILHTYVMKLIITIVIELFKKFKTFTQRITCELLKWRQIIYLFRVKNIIMQTLLEGVTLGCAQAHPTHLVAPPMDLAVP